MEISGASPHPITTADVGFLARSSYRKLSLIKCLISACRPSPPLIVFVGRQSGRGEATLRLARARTNTPINITLHRTPLRGGFAFSPLGDASRLRRKQSAGRDSRNEETLSSPSDLTFSPYCYFHSCASSCFRLSEAGEVMLKILARYCEINKTHP